MNRRDFIIGTAAVAVAPRVTGTTQASRPDLEEWPMDFGIRYVVKDGGPGVISGFAPGRAPWSVTVDPNARLVVERFDILVGWTWSIENMEGKRWFVDGKTRPT